MTPGTLHHIELCTNDFEATEASRAWLLESLGSRLDQEWPDGRSEAAAAFGDGSEESAAHAGLDVLRMIGSTPIRRFVASLGGAEQLGMIQHILDHANAAHVD